MEAYLRKRRKSLGYSIEKLAKVSGISASTIKNIEAKRHNPRIETFELLVKALDLSITYKEYYEKQNKYEDDLYGIFRSLRMKEKYKQSNLYSDGFLTRKKLKDDITYVGYTHLINHIGSVNYIILGKIYKSKEEYLKDIEKIKESVCVMQYGDKTIHFTLDYVKVNMVALEKSTLIEIVFGEFSVLEVNTCEKDLENFKEMYEKYNQFRIQLECGDEIFVIDCLNKIPFKI